MAIGDNLKAQWDINTRGRSDDDFYEHVNGVVEASAGTPTLEADGAEQAQNYDGSTSEYTEVTTWPVGLSTAFPDSDYTMAARVKLDTVDPGAFQSIFGAFKNGSGGLRVHLATETGNGQALGAQVDGAAGADVFLDAGVAGEIDDGAYHVVAQRRSGNVFALWVDGVERASTTVAAGSITGLDRIGFAGRTDGAVDWPLDGSITWAAIWDAAKSNADIQALDDSVNPFLSGPALTASDDDLELGEASLPSPISPGSVTVAASPAFGGTINRAYLSSQQGGVGFDFADRDLGLLQSGFSRAGAQTSENVDGTLEQVDRSRNVLLHSEDLTQHTLNNAAPSTADKLVAANLGGSGQVRSTRAVTLTAGAQTFSGIFEPDGADWVWLRALNVTPTFQAYVDISTGAVGYYEGADSVTVTASGSGYLVEVSWTATSADLVGQIDVALAGGNLNSSVSLDGSTGAYVRQLQVNAGTSRGAYEATGADNAAPAFAGARGVLLEESRTNEAVYSYNLDASKTTRGAAGTTYVASGGILGNGYTTLTGLGAPIVDDIFRPTTVSGSGVAYAQTLVIRNSTGSTATLEYRNPQGVTYGQWRIDLGQIGADWTVVTSSHAAVTVVFPFVSNGTNAGWWFSADTSGVSIDVAHVGFEQGAFPTSITPTNGSAVTRAATSLGPIPQSVWAPGAGSVVNDVAAFGAFEALSASDDDRGENEWLLHFDGDSNNYFAVYLGISDATVIARRLAGGVNVTQTVDLTSYEIGDTISWAARWTSTESTFRARVNSGTWVADTNPSGTALSTAAALMHIGVNHIAAGRLNAAVRALRIWTGADVPSDAELAALTADDLTMYPLEIQSATDASATVVAPDVQLLRDRLRWLPIDGTAYLQAGSGAEMASVALTTRAPAPTRVGTVTAVGAYHWPSTQIGDSCILVCNKGEAIGLPETGTEVAFNQFDAQGDGEAIYLTYRNGVWNEGPVMTASEPGSEPSGKRRRGVVLVRRGRDAQLLVRRRRG